MSKMEVFNALADCVSELERHIWALPHSATRLALETLVQRFDGLVDSVLTMDEAPQEDSV